MPCLRPAYHGRFQGRWLADPVSHVFSKIVVHRRRLQRIQNLFCPPARQTNPGRRSRRFHHLRASQKAPQKTALPDCVGHFIGVRLRCRRDPLRAARQERSFESAGSSWHGRRQRHALSAGPHARLHNLSLPAQVSGLWDLSNVSLPDTTAAGAIHQRAFTLERATLTGVI